MTRKDKKDDKLASLLRPASKRSVRKLTAQVKKETREMKAANAKLKRAHERFVGATRSLRQSRSKERRVTSAEHRLRERARSQAQHLRAKTRRPPPRPHPPRL